MTIRPATQSDAAPIAALSGQLGYLATTEEMALRLSRIQPADNHAVFVAELPGAQIVGWVHVFFGYLLVQELRAEIGGLVVDERHRHSGIGRALMRQAEAWARSRGCRAIVVRSSITREEAHAFYQKTGYEKVRTQHVFVKDLG